MCDELETVKIINTLNDSTFIGNKGTKHNIEENDVVQAKINGQIRNLTVIQADKNTCLLHIHGYTNSNDGIKDKFFKKLRYYIN